MGPRSTHTRRADLRLMTRFTRRQTAAAEEMYRRFAAEVYGIGLQTLHDPDLAATLVEDTFVRVWRRGSQFLSSSASLDEWVRAHAIGVALEIAHHRVDRRRAQLAEEVMEHAASLRA